MSDHEERMEQFAGRFPGERGATGERGPQGAPGKIPAPIRAAFAYLFVLMFVLIGLSFAGIWYYVHENNQQRCGGIAEQVAIPIPVPTAGNPSREWEAKFSKIERHRGAQLGCDMPPPRYAPSSKGG